MYRMTQPQNFHLQAQHTCSTWNCMFSSLLPVRQWHGDHCEAWVTLGKTICLMGGDPLPKGLEWGFGVRVWRCKERERAAGRTAMVQLHGYCYFLSFLNVFLHCCITKNRRRGDEKRPQRGLFPSFSRVSLWGWSAWGELLRDQARSPHWHTLLLDVPFRSHFFLVGLLKTKGTFQLPLYLKSKEI